MYLILVILLVMILLGGVGGPVIGSWPYGYGFGHSGVGTGHCDDSRDPAPIQIHLSEKVQCTHDRILARLLTGSCSGQITGRFRLVSASPVG